jgi:CRP-like cAMP-binding protein
MDHEGIERAIRRLELRAPLSEAGRQAVRDLPFTFRSLEPASYIVREGEPPAHCALLLGGFAYRHKITGEGARQILSVHMAGEFLDLQNSFLEIADHNVQALTRIDVAVIPVPALQRLAREHVDVGRAMWIDTLIDAAIFREWIVNVGRRDSLTRVAHLLCELALRFEEAGVASRERYELPMTQEQLADAVGLTSVHVNRVLKQLGEEGLIDRDRRNIRIVDWKGLREAGDFNERYLHHDAQALRAS